MIALALAAPSPAAPASVSGSHDFDWNFGTWKTHIKRLVHPLSGATNWVAYEGTVAVRPLLGGVANIETVDADGPSHIQLLAIRTYDPKSHQWIVNGAYRGSGSLGVPAFGTFHEVAASFTIKSPSTTRRSSCVKLFRHHGELVRVRTSVFNRRRADVGAELPREPGTHEFERRFRRARRCQPRTTSTLTKVRGARTFAISVDRRRSRPGGNRRGPSRRPSCGEVRRSLKSYPSAERTDSAVSHSFSITRNRISGANVCRRRRRHVRGSMIGSFSHRRGVLIEQGVYDGRTCSSAVFGQASAPTGTTSRSRYPKTAERRGIPSSSPRSRVSITADRLPRTRPGREATILPRRCSDRPYRIAIRLFPDGARGLHNIIKGPRRRRE